VAKSPAFRFYPTDFMGSPDVAAMDLHEVGAYVFLLCIAWQAERHGFLPDDEEKIRRWAKMTREQWAQSRELLLSKFPVAEPGWRSNPRLVQEAEKQEAFSSSQKDKANKRWESRIDAKTMPRDMPRHKKSDAGAMPSVFVSVSASEKQEQPQKQKPSRPPKAERVVDPRHTEFRENFRGYFLHKNPGLSDEPWDAQEAAQLSRFLKKNPHFTLEQWRSLLWNRARSNVSHGENLSTWIGRALTWASAPMQANGGSNAKPTLADNIAAKQRAIDARAARRLALEPDNHGRTLEAGGAGAGSDGDRGTLGPLLGTPQ
jgi:uncharacterized protein YdaU (DUF1376 family)